MSPGKCFLCSENKHDVRKPERDVAKKIRSCFRTQPTPDDLLVCGYCGFRAAMVGELHEHLTGFVTERNDANVGCFLCNKQTHFVWEVLRDKRRVNVRTMISKCSDVKVQLTSKHRICYRCVYLLEVWYDMSQRFAANERHPENDVETKSNSKTPIRERRSAGVATPTDERNVEDELRSTNKVRSGNNVSKLLKSLQIDICNAEAFSPKAAKLRERGCVRVERPLERSERRATSGRVEAADLSPTKKRPRDSSGESRTSAKRTRPARALPCLNTVSRVLSRRSLDVDDSTLSDKRMMHDLCYVDLNAKRHSTRTVSNGRTRETIIKTRSPQVKKSAAQVKKSAAQVKKSAAQVKKSAPQIKIKIHPRLTKKSFQASLLKSKNSRRSVKDTTEKIAATKTSAVRKTPSDRTTTRSEPSRKLRTRSSTSGDDERDGKRRPGSLRASARKVDFSFEEGVAEDPSETSAGDASGADVDGVETEIENPNIVICPTKEIIETAKRYKSGDTTPDAADDELPTSGARPTDVDEQTSASKICDIESTDDDVCSNIESQEMELKFEESDDVANGESERGESATKSSSEVDERDVETATDPVQPPGENRRSDDVVEIEPTVVGTASDGDSAERCEADTNDVVVVADNDDDEQESNDLEIVCSDEVVVSESSQTIGTDENGDSGADADVVDPETAVQNDLTNDKFQAVATMLEKLGA